MLFRSQIIGRAIRIDCHKKRLMPERNVTCFLHITVPLDPDDKELRPVRFSVQERQTLMAPLAKLVGDLHAYSKIHKKIHNITRLMKLIRVHAFDAVYRNWIPNISQDNIVLHSRRDSKQSCTWNIHSKPPSHEVLQNSHDMNEHRRTLGLFKNMNKLKEI